MLALIAVGQKIVTTGTTSGPERKCGYFGESLADLTESVSGLAIPAT